MWGLKRNSQCRKKLKSERRGTSFEAMTRENERHPEGRIKNKYLSASAVVVR